MSTKTGKFTDDDFEPNKEHYSICLGSDVDDDEFELLTRQRSDHDPKPYYGKLYMLTFILFHDDGLYSLTNFLFLRIVTIFNLVVLVDI